jgi:hypothetical protein
METFVHAEPSSILLSLFSHSVLIYQYLTGFRKEPYYLLGLYQSILLTEQALQPHP